MNPMMGTLTSTRTCVVQQRALVVRCVKLLNPVDLNQSSFSFIQILIHLRMYSLLVWEYVFIADEKVKGGTSPAPVTPTRRARLTLNQLVFHKVLGKGSFGKVHPTMTHTCTKSNS